MSRAGQRVGGSFRDPSGFIFELDGEIFRQIDESYADEYRALKEAGLLDSLASERLFIDAPETNSDLAILPGAAAVLRPERIPLITFPYEWSFGMLKDAALLTLQIQERALDSGFTLKDATAYNIQFKSGRPIFIDTLSLERYTPGTPWIAYAQFCRHFVAPLALMSKVDVRLQSLLAEYLDGIPLDLAARLLPARTSLNLGLMTHLKLHAKAISGESSSDSSRTSFSEAAMRGLISSLKNLILSLNWEPEGTEWADYYSDTNYSELDAQQKAEIVRRWLEVIRAGRASNCWDLGANDGRFSRIACDLGFSTVSADIDPAAVERAYRFTKSHQVANLHPLRLDLCNPSPARGWDLHERKSILDRSGSDVVLALALIHHLAIGNNVPLDMALNSLLSYGRRLIVEWVPKSDSQIQRMMRARKDVFNDYTEDAFVQSVPPTHTVLAREPIGESGRVLYLLEER